MHGVNVRRALAQTRSHADEIAEVLCQAAAPGVFALA